MAENKARIANTPLENLISNLRGEIGEIISTWVLFWAYRREEHKLRTGEIEKDTNNPEITFMAAVTDKLSDDIVSRLSELAQKKIGMLNFYFVSKKMNLFEKETEYYRKFIEKNRFTEKRNYNISHQELPEQLIQRKFIDIPYTAIVKAIAIALSIMKKIDLSFIGPEAPYLWREMRKRRYKLSMPLKINYLLLPYLKLSDEIREKSFQERHPELNKKEKRTT